MVELLLAILLGCLAGIITGLLPGLHVNTVAVIVIGAMPLLARYFAPFDLVAFLVSMAIVSSFLDFIPTIFFGAPEDATALSVLPGHKMLLEGNGYEALKLMVSGGIGTFLFGLAFMLPLYYLLKLFYDKVSLIMAPLLILLSVLFIVREKKARSIVWSLIIFGLAGALGLLVLNSLDLKQPLFPMLSGLFGVSTLVLSLRQKNRVCHQHIMPGFKLFTKNKILDYLKAAFSAGITSTLPGIGASQAAVISQGFTKFKDEKDFLVIVGGINTVSVLFTISVSLFIGKARSGVAAAVKEIIELSTQQYLALVLISSLVLIFAVLITLKLGKFFARFISHFSYSFSSLIIIAIISSLVAYFSGLLGLAVLLVSTLIGLLAPLSGVRRIHLMACLIVPVVLYFI